MPETAVLPEIGITEVPPHEVTGNEPVDRIEFPSQYQKGTREKVIDVAVNDNVYCMQDEYELPYTTVDGDGNTVVSVVEKVEPYFPETGEHMRAKLHVKIFKNEVIEVAPVPATGQENHPHERGFVDATTNALEHNMGTDRYRREIYRRLLRYPTTGTSPIRALRYTTSSATTTATTYNTYSAYNNDTDITMSATTYLRPYFHNYTNTATTTYVEWEHNEHDTAYAHHLRYWYGGSPAQRVIDPVERMKEILRSRVAPNIIVKSKELRPTTDIREIRARQTLRRLIGEQAFQKFAVRGFITFKGDSGRAYQIFPGHQKVAVWEMGKQIEQLCVVLTGDFPPTDSVIMRLLLIQESEDHFKKLANVFTPSYAPARARAEEVEKPKILTLPEIFASLKEQKQKQLQLVA